MIASHLVCFLLCSEELLAELLLLLLHVSRQAPVLLLQLGCGTLQIVCSLLNLQSQSLHYEDSTQHEAVLLLQATA